METRVTDLQTGGQKGAKPEAYALIPIEPLAEIARVYDYGASKYAPFNWQKGYSWNLSISALFRHIFQFLRGTSIDPETGCHHLAHAAFHLFTLMEYERCGKGTDDRGFKNGSN
jgi:hypothetical protein